MNVSALLRKQLRLAATLVFAWLLTLLAMATHSSTQLEITITGLSGEVLSNAEAALGLSRRRNDESLDAQAIAALHANAERELQRSLEPFGYYRSQVTTDLLAPDSSNPAWRANYSVEAGSRVPIVSVNVRFSGPGSNCAELTVLAQEFPLQSGQYLDHRDYELAKAQLLRDMRKLGYLDASFTSHQVQVDLAAYSAAVELLLDTGPRYVFGSVEFVSPTFSSDYLRHFQILQPGEPFNQARLSEQRMLLSRSGHFQEVLIETGEPTSDKPPQIPLDIKLVPYKPNRYRGRVGWGTDTGFGIGLDWTRRHVGRRGHHFNLGGAAVEERERLAGDASYTIPLDPISRNSIEFALRHESKDLTYEDVELDEGGETRIVTNLASIFWHLPRRTLGGFKLKSRAGLGFVDETYDVFEVLFGNLPGDIQDVIVDNIGQEAYDTLSPDFEAIVPSLRLTISRADDPLYIRHGDYYNLELLGTDEAIGSNIDFWQARFSSWNIWSIGDSNRLLVRTSLGYTDADSSTVLGVNFNQMPEYYEFRVGGARSVRGYGFEELFSADTITGGRHQAVASVEYEHEIIPDWSAAVFLDGGNAFNDWDDIDEKLGAGFGIRWRSPVGLARIDIGFPLDDAEDSFQIYITVGPEF